MEEFLEKLKEITAKSPDALTEGDIVFLKARRSYLTSEERKKFAKVLGIKASSGKGSSKKK